MGHSSASHQITPVHTGGPSPGATPGTSPGGSSAASTGRQASPRVPHITRTDLGFSSTPSPDDYDYTDPTHVRHR